jgi:hypothetical protein
MGGHAFWIVQCSYNILADDERYSTGLFSKFVKVYLYDVCTYSRTLEEQFDHLRFGLQRFKKEGTKLRLNKWSFLWIARDGVPWLHCLRRKAPRLDKKVEAVKE